MGLGGGLGGGLGVGVGGVLGVTGSLHNRSSGSGCQTSNSTLRSKEPNWAGGRFNDYMVALIV